MNSGPISALNAFFANVLLKPLTLICDQLWFVYFVSRDCLTLSCPEWVCSNYGCYLTVVSTGRRDQICDMGP
jgi:hypothetical protein